MVGTPIANDNVRQLIAKKNRLRLIMAVIIMTLYFGFAFGYGSLKELFASRIGDSLVPFGMVYFISLILTFIVIELIYLKMAKKYDPSNAEVSHYAE